MQEQAKNKRRPRGEGGIHQRADGLWVATVYVVGEDGERRQIRRTAKTKAEAIIKLRKLIQERDEGKLTLKSGKYTVAEWLSHWIEDIHRDNIRPSSRRDYKLAIRYVIPHIGKKRLDKLTAEDVRKMIRAIQKDSTRSAQKAHVALRRALDDAVSEEVLNRNVVRLVPVPKHVKKERGAYEQDVAKHILKTAIELDEKRDHGPYLASRWATAFLTGARQAEVLGLEWKRVDLKAGIIDISWQLRREQQTHGCGKPDADGSYPCGKKRVGFCPDRHWDLGPGFEYRECHRSLLWMRPKTLRGERYVPIVPALLETLKVYKRERVGEYNPHGLLWHHDDGRPVSQEEDNRAWNDLIAACGITKKRGEVVLHEARNTAATQLLEAGVDVKVIQGILGHASILTTRDYQRVGVEFAKTAISNLGELLPS